MKKLLIALIALMVAMSVFVGCSNDTKSTADSSSEDSSAVDSSSTDENGDADDSSDADASSDADKEPVAAIDGFVAYTNADSKIAFQYPEAWVAVTSEMLQDEATLAEAEELTGMSQDELSQMLVPAVNGAVFLDKNNSTEGIKAQMTLATTPTPGATQEMLTAEGTLDELTAGFDAQFNSILPGFEWVTEPEIKTLGGNTFMVLQLKGNANGTDISMYQAMIFDVDTTFVIGYSAIADNLQGETLETLETILSSVEMG